LLLSWYSLYDVVLQLAFSHALILYRPFEELFTHLWLFPSHPLD
jgi:hypothetical protein